MAKGHLICGLDVGTSNVKVLAAVLKPENGKLEIVGQSELANAGMRKGVVIRPDLVSQKIVQAIGLCQEGLERKISQVFVNIGGSHLAFLPGRGLVSVSRADQKISEADIERALQASRNFSLSANQEIIDVIPQEFIIDGQPGVREALGLRGIRLEAKVLCQAVFSPYLKNLTEAVLGSGLEIENIVPSVLASAQAVLNPKEKELGVALCEIGAGTTSLAVFEEGVLLEAAVFPLGSDNITNDIAVVLKTEVEKAEEIKKEFPGFRVKGSKKPKSRSAGFSSKTLSRVIEVRTKELLGVVLKELKRLGRTKLPSGVVLTGGGAKLSGLDELARKEFKLPVRLGLPRALASLDDPAFSTAAGLVLEGVRGAEEEGRLSFFEKGIAGRFKRAMQSFIP
jgi:cell division protein FtsA